MSEIKQCRRCIMDNANDPDLVLDASSVCNHCHQFDKAFSLLPKGKEKEMKLRDTIEKIKESGKGKPYDCLLGVSGGVDSSYLAYLCRKYELKPLIIHFDNGWNSELAVMNIQSILEKLHFDLYTHVINWEEFKNIQLSYFKAGVVDLEFPTDHAIIASMFDIAKKNKIKYILSGHNIVTEGTYLPKSWVYSKLDFINLKDIHAKNGTVKIKTFPYLSFLKKMYYNFVVKFEYVQLLNLVDYNKEQVKNILINELGWRDYGGKHFESVFTRFYQGYILPEKFKIDKRQFHYSCLVQSGQISREEALAKMKEPIYNPEMLHSDMDFVIKKLDFTPSGFKDYMNAPIHKHSEYKTEDQLWTYYFKFVRVLSPIKRLFKRKR